MSGLPRVGIAACFFHADPARPVFKGKTLLYLEQALAHWLMAGGVVPMLLPTPAHDVRPHDLLAGVHALVLQGGTDVAPASYGEAPLRPEWAGDKVRDDYERALIAAAVQRGLPILGVCRGLQILNVALGGTLYQDIGTQCEGAQVHRDWDRYDALHHDIAFEPGSTLTEVYRGRGGGRVNSVHHQGIRTLGTGLVAEARSVPDGIVEAIRYEDGAPGHGGTGAPFIYAVQWHPEFQDDGDATLLPTAPVRELFLAAVREAMAGAHS